MNMHKRYMNGFEKGFRIDVRLPIICGIYFSSVSSIVLKVDGEIICNEHIRILYQNETYSPSDLINRYDVYLSPREAISLQIDAELNLELKEYEIDLSIRYFEFDYRQFSRISSCHASIQSKQYLEWQFPPNNQSQQEIYA